MKVSDTSLRLAAEVTRLTAERDALALQVEASREQWAAGAPACIPSLARQLRAAREALVLFQKIVNDEGYWRRVQRPRFSPEFDDLLKHIDTALALVPA